MRDDNIYNKFRVESKKLHKSIPGRIHGNHRNNRNHHPHNSAKIKPPAYIKQVRRFFGSHFAALSHYKTMTTRILAKNLDFLSLWRQFLL